MLFMLCIGKVTSTILATRTTYYMYRVYTIGEHF